jgi:lipoprotein-releasing system permease protein
VISIISLIGIVIGVAALISVMSIFNGFREFTEKQLIGFDPHIRIIGKNGAWINESDSLLKQIDKISEIKSFAPSIQGRSIAINGNNMQVFTTNAIDENYLNKVSDIEKTIISGNFFTGFYNSIPSIVLGVGVADRLKVLPGDTITVISPKAIESSIKSFQIANPIKLIVSGLFQTNAKDFDNVHAFTDISIGKRLFKPPYNSISTIDIKLKNTDDVNKIKQKLELIVDEDSEVATWYELHKQLYDIMNFERNLAFVIISLIIIIAVFNVLASLTMTVVEKRKDIGILKAMGASKRQIRNIFIIQGTTIGIISTVIGTILGLAFCYGQIEFGWFKLGGANFLISAIPVSIDYYNVLSICIVSLVLSFVASIYPAKRASDTIVIEAIRNE